MTVAKVSLGLAILFGAIPAAILLLAGKPGGGNSLGLLFILA